jgi:hypothetical protein
MSSPLPGNVKRRCKTGYRFFGTASTHTLRVLSYGGSSFAPMGEAIRLVRRNLPNLRPDLPAKYVRVCHPVKPVIGFANPCPAQQIADKLRSAEGAPQLHRLVRPRHPQTCIMPLPGPPSLHGPRLRLAENIQHLRRSVRVVMGHLPRSGFSLIDVRDTMFDGDLLAGKLELPLLDARFVSQIPNDVDELIRKFNLPA